MLWHGWQTLADAPEALTGWLAWSLKPHGAAAFAALFQLGAVGPEHIRQAWMHGANRLAGGIFSVAAGLLVVTGYGLYYVNGETLRHLALASHWGCGLAIGLLLWWHRWAGRRHRRPAHPVSANARTE